MKILKIEKWWLILGLGVYALYNIPGVPAYGDARGAGIRNILGFLLMRSISCIFYMLSWTSSLPSLSP